MTNASHPIDQRAGSGPRVAAAGAGRGLDAVGLTVLGLAAHVAVTAVVVLAVMALIGLYDALAAGPGGPVLAGILVGLTAVLLIGTLGTLGVFASRRQDALRAWLADRLGGSPARRRTAIRAGFVLAVGMRGVLLAVVAAAPVAVVTLVPGSGADQGGSDTAAYTLLALCYLILTPLVSVRVARGLRRMRARRDRALRSTRA